MQSSVLLAFPDLSRMSDSDFIYPNHHLFEARLRCLFCHANNVCATTHSDIAFLRHFLKYPCTSCSLHLQNQLRDFDISFYSHTGSISWIHSNHFVQLLFSSTVNQCPNTSVTAREDSSRIWAGRATANYRRCLNNAMIPPCSSPQLFHPSINPSSILHQSIHTVTPNVPVVPATLTAPVNPIGHASPQTPQTLRPPTPL
jgi:hypothetical protein